MFINKYYPHDTAASQMIIGILVGSTGIWIAKLHLEGFLHYMCDFLGYGVHGIGFTNCHEALTKLKKPKKEKEEKEENEIDS